MSQFDTVERAILLVRHGSHAYGTNIESSDEDVKGVCIAPKDYYHGFSLKFEQEERLVSKGHPQDRTIYSIEKFMNLASDSNPNIIEVLNVDESDVLKADDFGKLLRENADLFLSKRARYSFSGFAISQLKRINTHRRWLMEQAKYEGPPPTRAEFGLPPIVDEKRKNEILMGLAEVQKQLDAWNVDMRGMEEHDKIHLRAKMSEFLGYAGINRDELWERAAVARFGADENLIRRLQMERAYTNTLSDWSKYASWKRSRNPQRAALEEKFGFDTKHAGHLVRLMRMCVEILEGKGVLVRREDAGEIKAIRRGEWLYDRVVGEAETLDKKCAELYEVSPLRHHPDIPRLNQMCCGIVERYHARHG